MRFVTDAAASGEGNIFEAGETFAVLRGAGQILSVGKGLLW
jgi:hypothetical protein